MSSSTNATGARGHIRPSDTYITVSRPMLIQALATFTRTLAPAEIPQGEDCSICLESLALDSGSPQEQAPVAQGTKSPPMHTSFVTFPTRPVIQYSHMVQIRLWFGHLSAVMLLTMDVCSAGRSSGQTAHCAAGACSTGGCLLGTGTHCASS